MKIGILTLALLVIVSFEDMLLGAPTSHSGTTKRSGSIKPVSPKSGKMISLTTAVRRPLRTSKKSAAIIATGKLGKLTATRKTLTTKPTSYSAGKTTPNKIGNLKDTRPRTTSRRSTITTRSFPTSKIGNLLDTRRTTTSSRSTITTRRFPTSKKISYSTGKTTPKKTENLKDTRRTTKSSSSTIKTPFGLGGDFVARPFPTSKGGNGKAQLYSIPGILYSSPFFHGGDYDYRLDLMEPPTVRNVTTTTAQSDSNSTRTTEPDWDRNVTTTTTTVQYDNITSTSSTELSSPLPEEAGEWELELPGITEEPSWNSTTTTTRKRAKRRKTTVSTDLTTRKRLKRKRTTTVATVVSENDGEYYENP